MRSSFVWLVLLLALMLPKNLRAQAENAGLGPLPSVSFKGKSVALSDGSKQILSAVADKVRRNPESKVIVTGYGAMSKSGQQLSWDRVNAVITYLVEKEGIGEYRFIFRYAQSGGDENVVDLTDGTGQDGPSRTPPPHMNLRTVHR